MEKKAELTSRSMDFAFLCLVFSFECQCRADRMLLRRRCAAPQRKVQVNIDQSKSVFVLDGDPDTLSLPREFMTAYV